MTDSKLVTMMGDSLVSRFSDEIFYSMHALVFLQGRSLGLTRQRRCLIATGFVLESQQSQRIDCTGKFDFSHEDFITTIVTTIPIMINKAIIATATIMAVLFFFFVSVFVEGGGVVSVVVEGGVVVSVVVVGGDVVSVVGDGDGDGDGDGGDVVSVVGDGVVGDFAALSCAFEVYSMSENQIIDGSTYGSLEYLYCPNCQRTYFMDDVHNENLFDLSNITFPLSSVIFSVAVESFFRLVENSKKCHFSSSVTEIALCLSPEEWKAQYTCPSSLTCSV